jgi:hypothetical protein
MNRITEVEERIKPRLPANSIEIPVNFLTPATVAFLSALDHLLLLQFPEKQNSMICRLICILETALTMT